MVDVRADCTDLQYSKKRKAKYINHIIKVANNLMPTKKIVISICLILVMVGLAATDAGVIGHASAAIVSPSKTVVNPVASANIEKIKADFAYEMAQLTAKIVSAQINNNVIKFKVLVNDEVDQTVAKISPIMSDGLNAEFANEMNSIKLKIYNNPKLDAEKAKADFAYDIARLTSKFLPKVDREPQRVVVLTTADASVPTRNITTLNTDKAKPRDTMEKYKADFKIEMDQLKSKIVSAQVKYNVIKFKVLVDDEVDQSVGKIVPTMSGDLKSEFANEMNSIKLKIYNNPKLNTEKAKTDFVNDISQLTSKFLLRMDRNPSQVTGSLSGGPISPVSYSLNPNSKENLQATVPTRSQDSAKGATIDSQGNYITAPQVNINVKPITPEAYSGLLKEVMTVGGRSKAQDGKIKISGGIRVHYARNGGSGSWAKNSSGVRADVGLETQMSKNWRLYAGFSAKKSFLNYDDDVDFRMSVLGQIGTSTLRAGYFGYFMADGNIYDDRFDGARFDFGRDVKFTLSYGNTKYTKDTVVATARYEALDYNLEAGAYIFRMNDFNNEQNKIFTLAGTYKFSNFSLGTTILRGSRKDSQGNNVGYVHSFNYGELKPWRKGTFNIWAKYYFQPRFTYIAPGMNGRGGWMQGYKGMGIGFNYTLAEDLVGSLEYYHLLEMTTGAAGKTLWGSLTKFF